MIDVFLLVATLGAQGKPLDAWSIMKRSDMRQLTSDAGSDRNRLSDAKTPQGTRTAAASLDLAQPPLGNVAKVQSGPSARTLDNNAAPSAPQPQSTPSFRVMATAVSTEVVRVRIGAKSTAVGAINVLITGTPGSKISGAAVQIAIAQAGGERAPQFLTAAQVGPVLMAQRGSRGAVARRILAYALMIGTSAAFPAISRQIGPGGAVAVSLVVPVAQEINRGLTDRIPSISDLNLEIPAQITIPEAGGVTIVAWSSLVKNVKRIVIAEIP